jgi:hypothetical protein
MTHWSEIFAFEMVLSLAYKVLCVGCIVKAMIEYSYRSSVPGRVLRGVFITLEGHTSSVAR